LLRHSVFSTLRHGLYRVFEDQWSQSGRAVSVSSRLAGAVLAGATAGIIANPCDIVLIRMQADGAADPARRRGYRHALDGIVRIAREEGVHVLWRGVQPCVFRAVLVTTSQITSYGTARAALEERLHLQGVGLNVCSAMCSGVVACLVTSPVDVVKTRMMQTKESYAGPVDCIMQALRTEGPQAFYKGLSATFLRLFPHTVMLWIVQERVSEVLMRWG